MKKVIVLGAFVLAFATASFAQTDNQVAPIATEKTEKTEKVKGGRKHAAHAMAKEMGLTKEQQMQMKDIANTSKGKLKAIKTDGTLDKNQKKAQVAEIKQAQDAQLKTVLSPEQYTKLKDMKSQRHANAKRKRGAN